jgi:hypothetical protein
MTTGKDSTWNDWSKLVISELDRLNKSNEVLAKEILDFKIDITTHLAKKTEVDELRQQLASQRIENINSVNQVKEDLVKKLNLLDREHSTTVSKLDQEHSIEITALKTDLRNKAGVWGAAAGMIPALVTVIFLAIKALS